MKTDIKIGIVGGSGLYDMDGLTDVEEVNVGTPFGAPSDAFRTGSIGGHRVAFLARHGRGHTIAPSELNFRANIFGFKKLGVERILSASAVGSLKEEHHPLEILVPNQFFDRTRTRVSTFFGDGLVAHVSFADPVCHDLSETIVHAGVQTGVPVKPGGTYLCMEGPQFSTKAESIVYRSWGMDVIGMTNLQEAKLAREAEICYATIALVTDYDCWHPQQHAVTVGEIIANLQKNAAHAQQIIRETVGLLPDERSCACKDALRDALITDPAKIPAETKKRLSLLIDKYL